MKRTSSYVEYSMHDYVLALTYLSSYSFKVSHRCWWATQKPNQQTLPSQMLSDVTGNLERAGTSTFVWKNQRFNDGFQWENYPENGPFHLDVWLMVIIYNDSSGNDGFQWEKGVVFRFFFQVWFMVPPFFPRRWSGSHDLASICPGAALLSQRLAVRGRSLGDDWNWLGYFTIKNKGFNQAKWWFKPTKVWDFNDSKWRRLKNCLTSLIPGWLTPANERGLMWIGHMNTLAF